MSQIILAPWSKPHVNAAPASITELSPLTDLPTFMKLMFGVKKWRVSFDVKGGSFDEILTVGERSGPGVSSPLPPYDDERDLFKTLLEQTASPKLLSNLVVSCSKVVSYEDGEWPDSNISALLSFSYVGSAKSDGVPHYGMGGAFSGGQGFLLGRPGYSYYGWSQSRISVVTTSDNQGQVDEGDWIYPGTISEPIEVTAYGSNHSFHHIITDYEGMDNELGGNPAGQNLANLQISAEEYWSYGGKYNTSTGAPI